MQTETLHRRSAVLLSGAVVVSTCAILVVVAYATRDSQLGTRSVHIDDAWVLLGWKAHRWVDIRRAGSTSLGFVLLVRGWLGIDGFSYHNAQLLTLVVSVLAAPTFLVTALRMRLRYPAALLGAAMLLASPILVSYATRVKQYSFEVLLAIVVIGLAASLLREPQSTRRWALFSLAAAVVLTISTALIGVIAAGVVVANVASWQRERPRSLAHLARSKATIGSIAIAAFVGAWYFAIVRRSLSPALRDFWSGFYLSEPHGTPNRPPFWHIVDTSHQGLLGHDWGLAQSLFRNAYTGPAVVLIVGFVVASALVAVRRPLYALLFGLPVVIAVVASFAQLAPFGGGRVDAWLYAPMTFMFATAVDGLLDWGRPTTLARGRRTRARRVAARGWQFVVGAGALALAVVFVVDIPEPEVFTWPDVVPLVHELEAGRARRDLVVVSGPLIFNYPLAAPQSFTTRVSDRNATHFTPVLDGVNAMNWADYAAPIAELRTRLDGVRSVWLLDTPEIIYPLGSAPRDELTRRGFVRVTDSRSGGAVLEHWQLPPQVL